jgi:ATP-binding cassette subfamily C protein
METIEAAEGAQERPPAGKPVALARAIEIDGVRFRHDEELLFDDLSLRIEAGSVTALVGPSGSGKTTVVDLVVGLVQPDAGEVRVDGTPLGQMDMTAWRRRIGYVPQEMFLLHDTVAMNVGLGDPDVDRDDIERALRDARAWDFVSRMPQGVDTVVGERGSALSGGQRQRIAIARALLHEPALLVLDEATAALDERSEAEIWETVASLRDRMAVLAISHQPALLGVADTVYRIDHGRAKRLDMRPAALAASAEPA